MGVRSPKLEGSMQLTLISRISKNDVLGHFEPTIGRVRNLYRESEVESQLECFLTVFAKRSKKCIENLVQGRAKKQESRTKKAAFFLNLILEFEFAFFHWISQSSLCSSFRNDEAKLNFNDTILHDGIHLV